LPIYWDLGVICDSVYYGISLSNTLILLPGRMGINHQQMGIINDLALLVHGVQHSFIPLSQWFIVIMESKWSLKMEHKWF
jgi:hypothetical protein